jgi:hypothetical protein
MEKKDAKYEFKKNLLRASHCKEFEGAKKEWVIVYDEKRDKQDGKCICQRNIKYVTYWYNKKTRKSISTGSSCSKKFNMGNNKVNKYFSKVFINQFKKGEYTTIDNIDKYCKSVQERLVKCFQNEFENIKKNYAQNDTDNGFILKEENYVPMNLKELLKNIEILIKDYELEYLQDIHSKIVNEIKNIYYMEKAIQQNKIYSVRAIKKNYKPENNTDHSSYKFYTTLEKCYEYISKRRDWLHEYASIKFEILCKNEIIDVIVEKKKVMKKVYPKITETAEEAYQKLTEEYTKKRWGLDDVYDKKKYSVTLLPVEGIHNIWVTSGFKH